jgi:hypothetical protein
LEQKCWVWLKRIPTVIAILTGKIGRIIWESENPLELGIIAIFCNIFRQDEHRHSCWSLFADLQVVLGHLPAKLLTEAWARLYDQAKWKAKKITWGANGASRNESKNDPNLEHPNISKP